MGYFDAIVWTPDWRAEGRSIRANLSGLRGLKGQTVAQVWGVWIVDHNEWYADFPVVITVTNGQQLELCWWKFDELSITWNSVQVNNELLKGIGGETLQWRPLGVQGFDLPSVQGAKVVDVFAEEALVQWHESGAPMASPAQQWYSAGLWIQTDHGGGIHVFNALDENGVGNQPELKEGLRVTSIL